MRIALLTVIMLAVPTPEFTRSLSGDQIRSTLVGNTFSGFADGESYSEHLNPDGTISGQAPSGAYAGRWRISRDQICCSYAEDQRDPKWDCTEVKFKASQIIWNDKTTATLSEGPR
jgi:hypothetical protein